MLSASNPGLKMDPGRGEKTQIEAVCIFRELISTDLFPVPKDD
jgi:hypothetical protein